jgi:hypothetical protein
VWARTLRATQRPQCGCDGRSAPPARCMSSPPSHLVQLLQGECGFRFRTLNPNPTPNPTWCSCSRVSAGRPAHRPGPRPDRKSQTAKESSSSAAGPAPCSAQAGRRHDEHPRRWCCQFQMVCSAADADRQQQCCGARTLRRTGGGGGGMSRAAGVHRVALPLPTPRSEASFPSAAPEKVCLTCTSGGSCASSRMAAGGLTSRAGAPAKGLSRRLLGGSAQAPAASASNASRTCSVCRAGCGDQAGPINQPLVGSISP